MIECSKCGSENHFDGAAFCKNCGSQLQARVAVEVADPSSQLNDTAKIPTTNTKAKKADVLANEEFTVEDVTDPADKDAEIQKLSPSAPDGGIDKLLSLYGNDEPIEEAQASDGDGALETTSLGIESASDFLLRQQTTAAVSPQNVQQKVEKEVAKPVDKISEIQSKLTQIEDKDQEVKNPLGGPSRKKKEANVSKDEKDRLISSLSRSLHNETVPAAATDPDPGVLNLHTEQNESRDESANRNYESTSENAAQYPAEPALDAEPVVPARTGCISARQEAKFSR